MRMNTWIALLRGINVGGSNILPMKDLVATLERLGLANVKTYIQSGNAVFQSPETKSSALAEQITAAIFKKHDLKPRVLVLSRKELEQAATNNPFPEAETEPKTLHLFFLAEPPRDPDLKALNTIKSDSERFVLDKKIFYLHAPEGIGRSKLATQAEKHIGVETTARNWRSVVKILEMTT